MSSQERRVLAEGSYKDGDRTAMLRRGEPLSPSQQKHLDDLNAALAKLPAHEGPVIRHTNLNAEQLVAYDALPRSNFQIADLNGTRFEGWFRKDDKWHDADGNVLYTLDRASGWYDNEGRLAYDLQGDGIE